MIVEQRRTMRKLPIIIPNSPEDAERREDRRRGLPGRVIVAAQYFLCNISYCTLFTLDRKFVVTK